MKNDIFLFDVINELYNRRNLTLVLSSPDESKVDDYCKLLREIYDIVFMAHQYVQFYEYLENKKEL